MKADLHTHTTASDGQYAPGELVVMAKEAGIECLAITDHDTLSGLDEAAQAGKKLGLRVVRGVELGASEHRHMHILGLGFSRDAPGLRELCQKLRDSRDRRKYRILEFLRERGVTLTLGEVERLAGGQVIARPHFARAMVERGYVKDTREAFDRYLDTDEFQKIERFKAPAAVCIQTIQEAGGKAVLAHPYQLGFPDEELERTVQKLKSDGLDGIECFYPKHTPGQEGFYLSLAEKYSLHITAGSDFHGEKVKPEIKLQPIDINVGWILGGIG